MKYIHFFGCSYTAGDELTDDIYFPWKVGCKTTAEYYQKRVEHIRFHPEFDYIKYQEENKKKAYPAILGGINHASNGASLKENILRIVQLINSDTPIDAIYLQIPPYLRELYITEDNEISSLILNSVEVTVARSYIEAKISTHDKINFIVNDVLELISFYSFLKRKNINFGIISFGIEMDRRRLALAGSPFEFLISELDRVEVIDFKNYLNDNSKSSRTLGYHGLSLYTRNT